MRAMLRVAPLRETSNLPIRNLESSIVSEGNIARAMRLGRDGELDLRAGAGGKIVGRIRDDDVNARKHVQPAFQLNVRQRECLRQLTAMFEILDDALVCDAEPNRTKALRAECRCDRDQRSVADFARSE